MASAFGHIASAIGIGSLFPKSVFTPQVLLIGAVTATIPDLDVLSSSFGIWGLDMLGHRGITHSFFFAFVWASLLTLLFHRSHKSRLTILLYYFICGASHGILDGLTNGGDGIAYFAPFSSFRTHLPYELIQVSPLGLRNFFSVWGLKVLLSELKWIFTPSLMLVLISNWIRKRR